ncbi:Ig-specific serine endopeptidase MIP [Metamycoplasma equirhinis]|uniref:Ig-specific serine endopeptidase MIP n=1 Tax=Metamycoplasma equirhinis TaxID=92402 RepID=UPI003593CDBC
MKKSKILLLSISTISSLAVPLFAASCGDSKKQKTPDEPNKKNEDKKNNNSDLDKNIEFSDYNDLDAEFKNVVDNAKLGETFNFTLRNFPGKTYKDLLPSQIGNNLDQIELKISDKLKDKFELKVNNIKYPNDNWGEANKTGKFQFSISFLQKSTKKAYQKLVSVEGFNSNAMGLDENGRIPSLPSDSLKPEQSETQTYLKATQEKRFELDNEKYMNILKRQPQNQGKSWSEVRDNTNASASDISKYNEKAKKLNLDTYENSAYKGFALPSYKSDGTVDGLNLLEGETGKGTSWVDALGRDEFKMDGLARTLPNEHYRRSALQTFSLHVTSKDPEDSSKLLASSGTIWLMDFAKENNGYPTKWYFGTNTHVADLLSNDVTGFSLTKMFESAKTKTTFRLTNLDANFGQIIFKSTDGNAPYDNGIRTIFTGKDYLKEDPSKYLSEKQKAKYKDTKEFIDFAVIEIDFSKLKVDSIIANILATNPDMTSKYKDKSGSEVAEWITNRYANIQSDQIKFRPNSYLSNEQYKKIDFPLFVDSSNKEWWKELDELFITGYPSSINDWFLRRYIDDDQIAWKRLGFSLWTNSDYRFYDQLKNNDSGIETYDKNKTERGNFLSYNIGYRTFTNKPGISDALISAHRAGPNLYSDREKKEYINVGLEYIIRHYAPAGGASGSSVRNQHNELVGVYHVSNTSAHTGLAAAFRSEGFNYEELFGSYNLPQYDLIYGGGKDQQNSYRDAMKKLFNGNGVTTALFPNGFDEDKIPEQFKFKNS